ncbi:Aste57867_24761 [Aphanomyces stellatus]|uniref:Aste57867_24761 protein n=1 Tax=Aphanomyces stellatus TaxID=120398 RepID=A0A485LSS5_9STRA|nr:hypothetical protein As57867_024683 [Aphanomyces stellatus]VFU01397.1 Aste57867_24761 [Aphanomyces stellatus]
MSESMSRAEFVQALALALATNEEMEKDVLSSTEIARTTYEALQYDFPQSSPHDLKVLATKMKEHGGDFPLTNMLFRNALELAQCSDITNSAAATLLVQCYFLPFQHSSLDSLQQFRLQENISMDAKLLFICYHTTYAPLSSLSLDDWNHLQCTDHCCSISTKLLHWPINGSDESTLLQMEWLRYMYLLRDRMIQYPVACAGILNKMLTVFTNPENLDAIEASQASSALIRLLMEVATAKELKQSPMAKSSILSIVRSMLPMMAKQILFNVDKGHFDDLVLHANLLEWAVGEDSFLIATLEDTGILRTFVQLVNTSSSPQSLTKQVLRLLGLCMLLRAPFAAFLERVPNVKQWMQSPSFPSDYPSEYAVWCLSRALSNIPLEITFENTLLRLFPTECTNALESRHAILDALYVMELLVKLQFNARWLAWASKTQVVVALQRLLPHMSQWFRCPQRIDDKGKEDNDSNTDGADRRETNSALKHRLRVAMKKLTSANNAKLD